MTGRDGGSVPPLTVAGLRREGRERLAESSAATDPREATLLLASVLGVNEAGVLSRSKEILDDATAARFRSLLARRSRGEPVAYLLGEREFYGRPFLTDSRVLIPRPETEHLVEVALERLGQGATVVDVGTGSGCIAITLALERPDLRVVAGDLSLPALAVARSNRARLEAPGVRLVAADLAAAFDLDRIDFVVSNPPYLAPAEAVTLSPDVRDHEPSSALFAEPDGLGHIRRLIAEACALRPGGGLALEIGAEQAEAVVEIASGAFVTDRIVEDYAGHQRVVLLTRR